MTESRSVVARGQGLERGGCKGTQGNVWDDENICYLDCDDSFHMF